MAFVAEPGKVLEGRYALRAQLGHGGMGTVWRAEHTKLKTAVAVKLVAPSLVQSAEARARFLREAQVAASLDSPNIVRITDFGIEDDTPFIAMELLEGETLGARLARGALSPDATLRIFSQIVRGISRAHQARVVHCDLKPENVFLAHVDGEDVVKIVDFGVAKAPLLDPLTQTGAVLGTLQYMSPEQLEGRKNVGAPSDLYSLAVIVFECICGQPAFRGDSIAELVRRICGAPLPVPSQIAKVSPAFDAWFAKAAHRDPAARFSSAREMNEALVAAFDRASSRSAAAVSVSAPRAQIEATVASFTGGDTNAGFRITPDARSRVLEVELWGMHDLRLAEAARKAFLDGFEVMKPGGKWVAIGFGSRHPPQQQAVQELEGATMALAGPAGMARMAFVIGSALAKMSARRLATENMAANTRFFEDEASARAWIAEALAPSRTGGTQSAGYRVTCDERARFVYVDLWGLHDLEIARESDNVLMEVSEMMQPGGPWVAYGTGARPPQRPEVQALEAKTMAFAMSRGMARIAFVQPNTLTKMMVRRLTSEIKMPNARFFNDEGEAREWLAEALLPARRGGDERSGFAIRADKKARILHLEFWGLWDMNVGRTFRTEVLAAYAEMGSAPWFVLSNARRYMPQKDEIQALHKETIGVGFSQGLKRVAALVDTALSQMQIRRMFEEAGSPPNLRFFTDEEDAREWLAEPLPRRGGDERAGFSLRADKKARLLHLEFWGLWDMALTRAFRTEVLAAYAEMGKGPWFALSQSRKYVPQKDEIQAIHKECIKAGLAQGLSRISVLVDSALGHMQIRRLFEEAGSPPFLRFFTDEAAARAWLAEPVVAAHERRGGDESAGFRVTRDTRARVLEIERWGLWNVALASEFKKRLIEALEAMKGAPWAGLSFASRHPPQSIEVQKLQGDTMAMAKAYGCVRSAMIAESALAAMMVRRLTQENHMDIARVFTTEREARAWLAEAGFAATP